MHSNARPYADVGWLELSVTTINTIICFVNSVKKFVVPIMDRLNNGGGYVGSF